jgi:hypothetical protein
MIEFKVKDSFKDAAKDFELLLDNREIEQAITRALNKAIVFARTSSVTSVRKIYKTRAKDIRKTFRIGKAGGAKLSAELTANGKQLPAYGFMSKANTRRNTGAAVNITGTSKVITGSFVARMPKTGHVGLFERYGAKEKVGKRFRQKIRELFTMSIPAALSNPTVEASVTKAIEARLPTLIQQELNFGVLLKSGRVTLGRR